MGGLARTSRYLAPRLALLAVSLLLMDGVSYLVGHKLQDHRQMYRAPVASSDAIGYTEFMAKRDPVLGWPPPDSFGGVDFDVSGARPCPSFPVLGDTTLVAVYGDSFAYGEEISHEDAWSSVLARRLGCRVANFGVPGYGTDQALLRFMGNDHASDVTILTVLTENVIRNVTRSLDLLSGQLDYAQKPRFILTVDGELEYVPIPVLDESEYHRVLGIEGPPLPLQHESFQTGGPSGATLLRFPYTLSIFRNLGYFRMRSLMKGVPAHAIFYEAGSLPDPLPVTRAIAARFVNVARERGQLPLVVMLPTRGDIEYHHDHGRWLHEGFLRSLQDAGLPASDLSKVISDHIGVSEIDAFFTPGGHYGPELNAALADAAYDLVRSALD